tara:strand:- start:23803 stop:25764 length:1962 start_codon:yes stop_codon:yes gene_type:complete
MRKFFQLYSRNINRLSIGIYLFSLILIVKFFKIQIIEKNTFQDHVSKIGYKTVNKYGTRGEILDKNKNILSQTITKYTFWINTNKKYDEKLILSLFSSNFNKPDSTYRKILNKKSNYVIIEKNILHSDCSNILKIINEIEGLKYTKNNKRFYPYNNLASQTLGFVNEDGFGQNGIEESLNTILSGDTIQTKLKKGLKGQFFDNNKINNLNGKNVQLTIDIEIQQILQDELYKTYKETKAKSANGIIIDPFTGDIISIASIPDYNPNNYSDYQLENFKNRTISDSYEPGSTFKIIPIIAAYEDNLSPNKKYFCENGEFYLNNGKKLNDHEEHDSLTVNEIFIHSSNIGISKIIQDIDNKEIYKLCKSLGFGSNTGLPLKSESKGILRNLNNWSKCSKTYISIGQEIGVTNIQLATAYSAIANGGFLLKPHIVKNISKNDSIIYKREVEPLRQVFNKEISNKILSSLEEVVIKGTAKNLNLNGYKIGGKTGTAQKFYNGEYSKNEFISSFASIFPIDKPKYVMIISIDSPEYGKHWSNESAVPTAKKIINRIIVNDKSFLNDSSILLAKNETKEKTNESINKKNKIKRYSYYNKEIINKTMPNLKGKTLKEAISLASQNGIMLKPNTLKGKVVWQSLKPGIKTKKDQVCEVRMSI